MEKAMRFPWMAAVSVALVSGATAGFAQTETDGLQAAAAQFGCNVNTGSVDDIRCCLALIDGRALNGNGSPVQQEAKQVEARLVALLASRGLSDRPRVCPKPTSSPIFSQPDSSIPRITGPVGGGQPPGDAPRNPANAAPAYELALSFGGLIGGATHSIDALGGGQQVFPAVAFSGGQLDARLSFFPWSEAELRRSSAVSATAAVLLFAGFSYSQYHVDLAENVGGPFSGSINQAFEGTLTQSRPYIGAGIIFPLIAGSALNSSSRSSSSSSSSSRPNVTGYVGANVGYVTQSVSDNFGPFSNKQNGVSYGVEAGIDVDLGQNVWLQNRFAADRLLGEWNFTTRVGVAKRF